MGLLDIDIVETKRRAARLEELSVRVKSVSDSVEGNCSSISGSWRGDGADSCSKKLRKLNSRLKCHSSSLRNISNGLRASAERIERLEQFATNLFK